MSRRKELKRTRSIFAHQIRGSLIALLISVVTIGGVVFEVANRSLMASVESSLRYHTDFRRERIINLFQQQEVWIAHCTDGGCTGLCRAPV